MSEWISVENALPLSGLEVLTYGAEGMHCAMENGMWYTQGALKLKRVTHWMPLPPPPEQNK